MRLSDAIRLGAMLHPQGHRLMRRVTLSGVETCALGAAREAGYPIVEDLATGYARPLQWEPFLRCPECHYRHGLARVIAHLNDFHQWTRERNADWVATVESARQLVPESETSSFLSGSFVFEDRRVATLE